MLKQIDRNLSYTYEFLLCRRDNREPIAVLKDGYNANSFVYKAEMRNVDELSFEVPYYVRSKDMELVVNPIWNKIKADMVVLMEVFAGNEKLFEKHFVVNTPKKVGADIKKKIINCYSYEQTLNNIKIKGFQGTRQLYKSSSDTVEIGEGILNLLEDKTYGDWKVGYCDPMVMNETIENQHHRKYRTFVVDNMSWLQFIRDEIEKSYECICDFSYDYQQKCNIINIYHTDNYGGDLGLYISEQNYIDRLEEEPSIDNLITRLTIKGKDGLTINSVNMGRAYLEDFSYYRNLDYMTQDLLDAFNRYDALIESNKPVFKGYLDQLNTLTETFNTRVNEKATLDNEMIILQDNKDSAIEKGESQTSINTEINTKKSQINAKQTEINNIKNQMNTISNSITNLGNQTSLESNFTTEQLKVINRYLREAEWSNENYYDVNSLLEAGKKAQRKMNEPQLNLNIDLASFIDIVDCQYDWKKLVLGGIVHCEYTLWEDYFKVRMVGYTHEISNKTLKLELSNQDFKNDAQRYLSDLSKEAGNTSNLVKSKKAMWDMSEQNGAWVAEFIANGLDATKYKVTAGRNQTITLDERGGTFGATDDPGIIRILNNVIALSEDGENYDLSITPQGIIAKKLIGELLVGQKLLINNELGTVQVNGEAILIKDDRGAVKVKLGKLDNSNYGICIYNKNGQVIVDSQGLVQMDSIQMADNIDSSHPLKLKFYIPPTVLSIRNVSLNFSLENFRTYEKALIGGSTATTTTGGSSETTTDGTLHIHSLGGIARRTSFTDVVDLDWYEIIQPVTTASGSIINTYYIPGSLSGDEFITAFEFDGLNGHTHNMNHHHGMNHTHSYSLDYGIFESTKASNVSITINGTQRYSGYNNNENIIDVTDYIQSGWNTILLSSATLGRINCAVSSTYFVGA